MEKLVFRLAIILLGFQIACTQRNAENEVSQEIEVDSVNLNKVEKEDLNKDSVETTQEAEGVVDSVIKMVDTTANRVDTISIEAFTTFSELSGFFGTTLPGMEHIVDIEDIPEAATVGIKPYPNAYIIQIDDKTEYLGKHYVNMEMVSPDSIEQILVFYKKSSEQWYHAEKFGVHTFKQEEHTYFRGTNTLQILPLNKILYVEVDSLLKGKAQSLVRIYYEIGTADTTETVSN